MSRRAARAAALQALFQIDLAETEQGKAVSFAVEENSLGDQYFEFVNSLTSGVQKYQKSIDTIINELSVEWGIERMPSVDRNILRMAVYEMCFSSDTPLPVSVNEAIELGKTFSTEESGKFINGILGRLLKDIENYRAKFLELED